jgi:hypothetical protein
MYELFVLRDAYGKIDEFQTEQHVKKVRWADSKVKVKLSLCLTENRAMKMYPLLN